MVANNVLEAKFNLSRSNVWLTGVQAVVRAVLSQSAFDQDQGIESGGYISGYRGSPLGGLDLVLGRVNEQLKANNVVFQPAINEDLAATALWGSQQVGLFEESRRDGVFGLWYGKSPGLDRSTDAIRHANMAGTAPKGGVLAVVGDDPECKSSTLPSDSSGLLRDLQIPILDPSNIAEIIEYAIYGWALSRYVGCWVSMLAQTSIMDSSATIQLPQHRQPFERPVLDFDPHIRLTDTPLDQEKRLEERLAAVPSFLAANPINQVISDPSRAKLTVITTGKSYGNLRQAFQLMGISSKTQLEEAGIKILKLAVIWPLDRDWLTNNLSESQVVLVVESKHAFIETSLRSLMYGKTDFPIVGKVDQEGKPLLPSIGELQIDEIINALGRLSDSLNLGFPSTNEKARSQMANELLAMNIQRKPLFCPGCPHAHSTKIPEGSRAHAGIGCHYMAQWMHRETYLFTHMGGEGANWIGQAPFTDTPHVFVNLGDGTYFHSGLLAIRAAVAAGVNVTYKILFNDAVAMTGGQPVDGQLRVSDVVAQVEAEGVKAAIVVADDPSLHRDAPYTVKPRQDLQSVQRELRSIGGCTVLVVDHACANEKKRRQKRGLLPKPDSFVVINEAVCEGCGDCVSQSACSAVVPVQTEYGVKRQIDQTHCIQDEACLDGFCPALVEVRGHRKLLAQPQLPPTSELQDPKLPVRANILITGVGGTGVVTASQLLAAAAHIEEKQVSSLDMTGLAQKGGAVLSHVRIDKDRIWNTRISRNEADVLIGIDGVTVHSREVAELLCTEKTKAVLNESMVPSYLSVIDRGEDHVFGATETRVSKLVSDLKTVDADRLAKKSSGSGSAANVVMLGFSYQLGLLPVSADSIEQAIQLNGVSVEANLNSFAAGRQAAIEREDKDESTEISPKASSADIEATRILKLIESRVNELTAYSNSGYAKAYRELVFTAVDREEALLGQVSKLSELVASAAFKMFAYKDEFEVARLLLKQSFKQSIESQFEDVKIRYAFAPTWLQWFKHGKKVKIGEWSNPLLKTLVSLRWIRGHWYDPFSYSREGKLHGVLKREITEDIKALTPLVQKENYAGIVRLFKAYDEIAGYGHIREASWQVAKEKIDLQRQKLSNLTGNA